MNTLARQSRWAKGRGASTAIAAFLCVSGAAQAAVDSGSTGADGELSPTVNTEVVLPPSGILNYTTINIPAGVTVTFRKNATNTPVHILASGNVAIAGIIDVRGKDAAAVGSYGGGAVGDDGNPGVGGPGGYDGGRGGREDLALRAAEIRAGSGLGPGGGRGGTENPVVTDCAGIGHYSHHGIGTGGAHSTSAYLYDSVVNCGINFVTVFSKAYGSELLQPLIGGSGGGGGRGGATFPGPGGGGGGGAVLIASSATINLTGQILATGGDGGDSGRTYGSSGHGWPGAGGSGGAIRLIAATISGNGVLDAQGGCITNNGTRRQQCSANGTGSGHGGSHGRIRIEADTTTYTGTPNPAAVRSTPTNIFIANAPSLRIATVAGQASPAAPTGNADITLPASSAGPVEVTFQTTNVPVGSTVRMRVVPAYGQATEVQTPAITGTDAAGTASATVTLVPGPSTLQATTTYTVVVAGDLDLSRFAQNERVEKVEVTVSLDQGTTTQVITASGKRFDVPFASLRAAGFRG